MRRHERPPPRASEEREAGHTDPMAFLTKRSFHGKKPPPRVLFFPSVLPSFTPRGHPQCGQRSNARSRILAKLQLFSSECRDSLTCDVVFFVSVHRPHTRHSTAPSSELTQLAQVPDLCHCCEFSHFQTGPYRALAAECHCARSHGSADAL